MSDTDDMIDWLTRNTVAWSLEVDPHRLIYMSIGDYLVQQAEMRHDTPPANLAVLANADHLFEARAYPTSAVGFIDIHDMSAQGALRRLREALTEETP